VSSIGAFVPAFDPQHPDVAKMEYPDSGAPGDNLLDAGELIRRAIAGYRRTVPPTKELR